MYSKCQVICSSLIQEMVFVPCGIVAVVVAFESTEDDKSGFFRLQCSAFRDVGVQH